MNILDAKNQIKDTVRAYMSKDETGAYLIDIARQRPLFLIGAPGIGKTAIVEQVACELGIGLVSYSMTHHTRQSALGLPFIEHKTYGAVEFDVSEYTMSEIIASMYDYMAQTGLSQGILFLDEINCVSETLYPSMLQFLQFKTFGRHRIPDDWIVVCAGNPPEYNRSVHEFDIVTMDRLRRIDIEPEYAAWKAYATEQGLHPAVTSYLEVRHDDFYMVEAKLGGKSFVTARGWEDLAQTISLFERQGTPVNAALVQQFLQDAEIAERFAAYYDLFNKYRADYQVEDILAGQFDEEILERAQAAGFDERLALLGLLLDSLGGTMFTIVKEDEALNMVRSELSDLKAKMRQNEDLFAYVGAVSERFEGTLARSKDIGTASAQATRSLRVANAVLHEMMATSAQGPRHQSYIGINQVYRHHAEALSDAVQDAQTRLDNAFAFIDTAFNQKRELLVFVTELTARSTTMRFLNRFGSESYFAHNQDLLVEDNRQKIAERISELPAERIAQTAEAQQNPLGLNQPTGAGVTVVPIALSAGSTSEASHARVEDAEKDAACGAAEHVAEDVAPGVAEDAVEDVAEEVEKDAAEDADEDLIEEVAETEAIEPEALEDEVNEAKSVETEADETEDGEDATLEPGEPAETEIEEDEQVDEPLEDEPLEDEPAEAEETESTEAAEAESETAEVAEAVEDEFEVAEEAPVLSQNSSSTQSEPSAAFAEDASFELPKAFDPFDDPFDDADEQPETDPAAFRKTLENYYANEVFEFGFNSMCKMTLPEQLSGKMVLDIGCRRGKGVYKLSDRVGITGHVVGIDWSREFIAEAKRGMDRAWQDSGLPESNMEFYWGFPEDLAALDIRDNSMDLVFINSVINLAYDPRKVLHEIFRVLRYGGLLICETVVATAERDGAVVHAARGLGNSVQSAPSQRAFEQMLAEEGFSIAGMSYRDVHKVEPTDGYIAGYTVEAVPSNENLEFKALVAQVVKPKANVLPRAIRNGKPFGRIQ